MKTLTHFKITTAASMLVFVLTLVFLASSAGAGIVRTYSHQGSGLAHMSKIDFRVGFWNQDDDDPYYEYWEPGLSSRHDIDDFTFSLGYQHWVDDNLAVTMRASVLEAESDDWMSYDGPYTEDQVVVGLFFGIRHYFPVSDSRMPLRPYVGAAVGPVIGTIHRDWDEWGVASQSWTETTIGGHFGGGLDVFMGPHMVFNLHAGYNAVSEFDRPIAGRTDFSGMEFGVGFGVAF